MIDMHFLGRLLICCLSITLLVRCYFQVTRQRNNAASFMLFGFGIFLVTHLLHNADVSMGFAFGLFAIFSMLRYRTEAIDIKEMTYLFLVITIALLSAVSNMQHWELLMINVFIIISALLLETHWLLPKGHETQIEYEIVNNIKPENKKTLMQDLQQRTGLQVTHVDVISINYLKDTALLRVHYVL